MKPFIFLLLLSVSCASCQETIADPEPAKCTIGYLEVSTDSNAKFYRTTAADTIHFAYYNQAGQDIQGSWIQGHINWDCIGFTLRNEPFEVTITCEGETCILVVPSLDQ